MNTKPLHETLTFSGLQRYVRICETVFNSDAMLSRGDRYEIAQDLLSQPSNPNVHQIEEVCQRESSERLGANMIDAQILRTAHQRN